MDANDVIMAGGRLDPTTGTVLQAAPAPANGAAATPELPKGVWVGTLDELERLDLPEPKPIGRLGPVAVVAGTSTLLHGPPGVSKTLLAFLLALLVAFDGHRVLIVEGEGSRRSTRDRLRRLAGGLGYDGTGGHGSRVTLVQGPFGLEQEDRLWRAILDQAQPALVVIDPLVSYARGNENDAREVAAFLRCVDIAREYDASVVLLHHATKPDAEGKTRERGSSALRAWADSVIALSRGADATEVLLTHEKARDSGLEPVQTLTWTFTEATIALATGNAPAGDGAVRESAARRKTRDLLGHLASGSLQRTELRRKLSVSGKRLDELLAPLLVSGRVVTTVATRTDKAGEEYTVEVLALGPGSGVGQAQLSTNEVSTNESAGN